MVGIHLLCNHSRGGRREDHVPMTCGRAMCTGRSFYNSHYFSVHLKISMKNKQTYNSVIKTIQLLKCKSGQKTWIDSSPKKTDEWSIAHEKMLNSISHCRNANQNYIELLLHSTRMQIIFKNRNNECWLRM